MRKIKFRGYDVVGKKGWVYGDLVHNHKVTTTGLTPRVMVGGYEVDPESVGQYTGTKDRKGNEVYEGDIVLIDDKNGMVQSGFCTEQCAVEYIDCGFYLTMIGRVSVREPGKKVYTTMLYSGFDVIGNIYEQKAKQDEA